MSGFKLRYESGFAYAWLPHQSDHLSTAVHGLHQPLIEHGQFTLAANEWAQEATAGQDQWYAVRSESDHSIGLDVVAKPGSDRQFACLQVTLALDCSPDL
jgi:hypothetical protein